MKIKFNARRASLATLRRRVERLATQFIVGPTVARYKRVGSSRVGCAGLLYDGRGVDLEGDWGPKSRYYPNERALLHDWLGGLLLRASGVERTAREIRTAEERERP